MCVFNACPFQSKYKSNPNHILKFHFAFLSAFSYAFLIGFSQFVSCHCTVKDDLSHLKQRLLVCFTRKYYVCFKTSHLIQCTTCRLSENCFLFWCVWERQQAEGWCENKNAGEPSESLRESTTDNYGIMTCLLYIFPSDVAHHLSH